MSQFSAVSIVFPWLISTFLSLLLLLQPAQAAYAFPSAPATPRSSADLIYQAIDILCAPESESHDQQSPSIPAAAEACLSYGNPDKMYLIKIISSLRTTNLIDGAMPSLTPWTASGGSAIATNWKARGTGEDEQLIQVLWSCPAQNKDNACYDADNNLQLPSAATIEYSYGYDKTKQSILFSTRIDPSNIVDLGKVFPEILLDMDLNSTVSNRNRVASICSDGSFVKAPSTCPRR